MLMYMRIEGNKRELNARGRRLADLVSGRVSFSNKQKRNGLHISGDGLVMAVDLLRSQLMWTAAAALIDAYGFKEKEFTEAEYAADCLERR
jgi:hypothetical protein